MTRGLYYQYSERARTLDGVVLYATDDLTLTGEGDPDRIRVARVTTTLAPVMRVWPISRPRFYAVLLGIFAAVAVTLAAVGLYGVMAYSVTRRTREIGIRMALGAARADVLSLVLGQTLVLTVVGITLGLAGSAAFTRYLAGLLFGLTPLDPTTFIAVALVFGAVATGAALVPARRATNVDPLIALRYE
jgi:putative ABC transport system permease protein